MNQVRPPSPDGGITLWGSLPALPATLVPANIEGTVGAGTGWLLDCKRIADQFSYKGLVINTVEGTASRARGLDGRLAPLLPVLDIERLSD